MSHALLNTAIELTCLVMVGTFLISLFLVEEQSNKLGRIIMALSGSLCGILAIDAYGWYVADAGTFQNYVLYYAGNGFVYILGYLYIATFIYYVVTYLRMYVPYVSSKIMPLVSVVFSITCILVITTPLHGLMFSIDESYQFQLGPLTAVVYAAAALIFGYFFVLLLRNSKYLERRATLVLSLVMVLYLAAVVVESILIDIMVLYLAASASTVLLYMSLQLQHNINFIKRENATKTSLMLSQIQPHFLINSLLAIKSLIHTDPEEAAEALDDFSYYLRGNMNVLTCETLLSFDEELKHVDAYLMLEKKRYGDRLGIEKDIESTDMRLPALTLQPLVENAVRHGVSKREEGGTVTITTRDDEGYWTIAVTDDGVGFDASDYVFVEGRRVGAEGPVEGDHVGLGNVAERIAQQCNGTLTIKSSSEGTRVTLRIPKA